MAARRREPEFRTYDELVKSGFLKGLTVAQNSNAMCVSGCLARNYGEAYEVASALSPVSALSFGYEIVKHALTVRGGTIALRNLYGDSPNLPLGRDFNVGVRQMRTLSQFQKFNVGMSLIGAGALGFQVGAQGYCRVSCAFDQGN